MVSGGLGNDTMSGGEGSDTLTGGAGFDTFITEPGLLGHDVITDFSKVFDVLDFTGVFADFTEAMSFATQGAGFVLFDTDMTLVSISNVRVNGAFLANFTDGGNLVT